ncbi:hypothetical protein BH11PSE12_BH11PSE12_29200 [soil metagenome]
MKTTLTSIARTSILLSATVLTGVLSLATAFQAPQVSATPQTVYITGQRMSTEEKIAFDTFGAKPQTVIISARRLTEEQKLAMAEQEKDPQSIVAKTPARAQNNG